MKQFIAEAKAGKAFTYGSPGSGSPMRPAMALLRRSCGSAAAKARPVAVSKMDSTLPMRSVVCSGRAASTIYRGGCAMPQPRGLHKPDPDKKEERQP